MDRREPERPIWTLRIGDADLLGDADLISVRLLSSDGCSSSLVKVDSSLADELCLSSCAAFAGEALYFTAVSDCGGLDVLEVLPTEPVLSFLASFLERGGSLPRESPFVFSCLNATNFCRQFLT